MIGRIGVTTDAASNSRIAVGSTSTNAAVPGPSGGRYLLSCNTDCYVKWGTTSQTASNSSFNLFMPKGAMVIVELGSQVDNIAVIRDSADGSLAVQAIINT